MKSDALPLTAFEAEGFWKNKMELVRTKVLPYQWEILNDRVEDAAPSFCMRNFRIASEMMKEKREEGETFKEPSYTFRGFETLPEDPDHPGKEFYGFVFQDSDFSKWIEAVAYSLTRHPDSELERTADEAIELVVSAQHESGYLDTYYIINGMDRSFTNLRDHHELYCFGHLTEGAVAYYQATGKRRLLDAVIRFADLICEKFGEEKGKCKGYPGHEIAEMALFRLYDVTKEERYLRLAEFFLEQRGKSPIYFESEENGKRTDEAIPYAYYQAHEPVTEQKEAMGHAVRAMYLYCGAADLAKRTGEERWISTCRRLWKSTVREKMYLTGGIGSCSIGEAFTQPFDLPNDLAYAENCASIGLVFWAGRMLQIERNPEYADVMERALYNTVLSGMDADGTAFFYVNPLEVVPESCRMDPRKFHVKPVRQKWFGCACCPPNLARLVSSLPSYAFTEDEDSLYVHLQVSGTVKKTVGENIAKFRLDSGLPYEGTVRIRCESEEENSLRLAVHIPEWGRPVRKEVPGELSCSEKNGYLMFEGVWKPGAEVLLEFPMEARILEADSRVRENAGKAAVMRGPLVYCAEERDNGADLHLLKIRMDLPILEEKCTICGEETVVLKVPAVREKPCTEGSGLYRRIRKKEFEEVLVTMIPYYLWANRGENEMAVWLRTVEG